MTSPDQLTVWQIEKDLERETDEGARLVLLQRRLEAQRRVSLPTPPSAGQLLPSSGFDLGQAIQDLRAQERGLSQEEREQLALEEDAALRRKSELAAGGPRPGAELRRVPEHFRDLVTSPRQLDRTAAVAAVEEVRGGGLLFLLGPHDAGKSTAGAAALRPSGLWVSGSLLFEEWRDHKEELLAARRLTIDEFGRGLRAAEQRAASAEILITLLHERSQRRGLETVVTANLDKDGLKTALQAPRKGKGAAVENWSLAIERLREFGRPRALSDEARRLGASLIGPGVVLCPYEGFRQEGFREGRTR